MRLTIVIEGQEGVTWDEWVAVAGACEEAGLDGLFVADHYLSTVSAIERGTLDAWATLAALAARTSRIRLGSLVSPATFRHPANLARTVTTVDHVSGGRAELGLGSGWYEPEHDAFGFALPPLGGRMALLDEQLAVIDGLWRGGPFRHEGPLYRLDTPEVLPLPVQRPRPTVIVGGTGKPRTIDIAVRRADEYNTPYATPDECRTRVAAVRAACEAAGRDPASIVFSAMPTCIVGSDRADYERRARALSRGLGNPGENPVEELVHRAVGGIFGTVRDMVETVRAFADAGVDRLHLQHLAPSDTEMIRLIGAEVAPRRRGLTMDAFVDRLDAGRRLAAALAGRVGEGALVLGLPRGGVPVAAEAARRLGLELDVLVVRKLGVPGHAELAMGAIAAGALVRNEDVLAELRDPEGALARVEAAERVELERRERAYRGGRPPLDVAGREVVVVDDGLATGATMRAAVAALRVLGAGRVVVAVPVAPPRTLRSLAAVADDVVCVLAPEDFVAVGAWYADFDQVEDAAVRAALTGRADATGRA